MTARNPLLAAPPFAVDTALATLGANLRTARVRRGLTAEDMAAKIGVGRRTISDAEKGKPSTAIAVYVAMLWALGLIDQIAQLADPTTDAEGVTLARAREPKRARRKDGLDNEF